MFTLLALIFVLFGCVKNNDLKVTNDKDLNKNQHISISQEDYRLIREELSKLLQIDPKTSTMIINKQTGKFIRGNISYNEKDTIFLAVKNSDNWNIVYYGAGEMLCEEFKKYGFPSEMIVDCQ